MGSIPNTVRRKGMFHFRRGVPAALQSHFNRAELTCSLRTTNPAVARRLSRYLYVRSEELFDAARAAPMLSEQDIAALVREFYNSILAQDENVRLMRDDPIPEGRRAHYVEHYRQLAERARIDLANGAYGSVRSITSTMIAHHFGDEAQLEKADVRRVSQAMLRAGIEVAETLKSRAEGDFNYEPKDKLLQAALQSPPTPMQAERQPEPAPPPAPAQPTPAGPPFSEEAETFRLAQLRRKVWEQQTGLQARKTYAMFAEFFGDKPLAHFTKRDAARFKELLEDLPANYGKAAEYRGMRAEQIVEMSRTLDVQRLSPRTVQRHFAALSTLWDHAIEHERADTNVFAGWKFAASKRARDQRQMWEKDELGVLFATPVWTGCQSINRRSKPGMVIVRDEKFWLPLIAVFSGMRQEEICQLCVAPDRGIRPLSLQSLVP